jgi:hypothetical protein
MNYYLQKFISYSPMSHIAFLHYDQVQNDWRLLFKRKKWEKYPGSDKTVARIHQ